MLEILASKLITDITINIILISTAIGMGSLAIALLYSLIKDFIAEIKKSEE